VSSQGNQPVNGGKNISALKLVMPYITPYKFQLVGAAIALLFAAATVLAMGAGLRFLIDEGFAAGDPHLLDQAVIVLVGVVILLAVASFARFYLISWV
jgi:ATP-binding cassette subfamily B protein